MCKIIGFWLPHFRCSHEILLQHLEKINRCRVCIGCESSRWKLLLLYVLKLITSQSSIHPSKFTPDNCFYEAGIESGSWSHNVVLFYWKQFLSGSHAVEYFACNGFLCRGHLWAAALSLVTTVSLVSGFCCFVRIVLWTSDHICVFFALFLGLLVDFKVKFTCCGKFQ